MQITQSGGSILDGRQQLKAGHQFEVEIDETGRKYPARIQRLGARIDPVSQSLKASAVIDGKYPELLAGMSGRLLLSPPN